MGVVWHWKQDTVFQGSHVMLNGAHLQVFFFKKTKSQCLAATLMSPHDDLLLMLDLSLMLNATCTFDLDMK